MVLHCTDVVIHTSRLRSGLSNTTSPRVKQYLESQTLVRPCQLGFKLRPAQRLFAFSYKVDKLLIQQNCFVFFLWLKLTISEESDVLISLLTSYRVNQLPVFVILCFCSFEYPNAQLIRPLD